MLKIKDTINVLSDKGIFQTINDLNVFEWLDSTIAEEYDMDYYLSYSGNKRISATYSSLIDLENDGVIVSALVAIAKLIINRHKDDWDMMFKTMTADYEPLDSYNSKEVETPDITKTRTSNFKSITDLGSNLYGFNTTEADGVGVSKGQTVVEGSADDNIVVDSEEGTRTREKTGYDTHPAENILKTLSILKFNLFELLAKDVDSVLTNLEF